MTIPDRWPDLCGKLLKFMEKDIGSPSGIAMSIETFRDFIYHNDFHGAGLRTFKLPNAPGGPEILGFKVQFHNDMPLGVIRLLGDTSCPSNSDAVGQSDGMSNASR